MKALLDAITRHAKAEPDSAAITSSHETLSYSRLLQDVRLTSERIQASQFKTIGLYLDNGIDWIVSDLACHLAGITVVPLPWFFSPEQLSHACGNAAIDAVVSCDDLPWESSYADTLPPFYRNTRLVPMKMETPVKHESTNKGGKVSYTSGTTGTPKGIYLSNSVLEQTTDAIAQMIGGLNIKHHLSLLPYATLLENIAGMYVPLMLGGTVHAHSGESIGLSSQLKLDPTRLAKAINTIKPQSLILTPELLTVLITLTENQLIDASSLRFVAVGGARVSDRLILRAREMGIPAYEGYGLTEFASVACLNTPQNDRVGSVGKPLPGTAIEIAQDGEIILLRNGTENSGKVATGDIGFVDDENYLYIRGRKKNIVILSTGRNVSPEWIEAELNTSPLIRHSYVFGEGQTSLSALIVATPEVPMEKLQFEVDSINSRLPHYARIGHWQISPIPFSTLADTLTPNGRLKRDNIESMLKTRTADSLMTQHTAQNPVKENSTC